MTDYHAFVYGRNWRLKNRSEIRCDIPYSILENDLWKSFNVGCNSVKWRKPAQDVQRTLF